RPVAAPASQVMDTQLNAAWPCMAVSFDSLFWLAIGRHFSQHAPLTQQFNPRTAKAVPIVAAWFNFSIFAGDKSWVAGVELATASEPPARWPRIWGRRPRASTPATPRCNLLLNHAQAPAIRRCFTDGRVRYRSNSRVSRQALPGRASAHRQKPGRAPGPPAA